MATPRNTGPPTPTRVLAGNQLKRRLMQDIESTLLKFDFKHLLLDEILNLFELDQNTIEEKIENLKLKTSKKSCAMLLSRRAKQAFSIEEMRDIQHVLLLYRTAFKYKGKRWFPFKLLEPEDHFLSSSDTRIVVRDIQQIFRIKGQNAVVKVIKHDDLMWVMIIEKKLTRRKGIKLGNPLFFCYEVGVPYLFSASGSKVPGNVMEYVVKALQYKEHKIQQINSRDVLSLLSLLKNKGHYKENLSRIEYEPGDVELRPRTVDYSQCRARRKYADKVFETKDPVLVDCFTAQVDGYWRKEDLVPEMAGEPIKMKVTFTSKTGSVVDMMKDMQAQEMIPTPIPSYMQELLKSAKNVVRTRAPPPTQP